MTAEELYKKEFGNADSIPKESVLRLLKNFAKALKLEREQALRVHDVGGSFTKDEVINILQKRADNAFHKSHEYERNEILQAIDIITRLMPPSSFPDW